MANRWTRPPTSASFGVEVELREFFLEVRQMRSPHGKSGLDMGRGATKSSLSSSSSSIDWRRRITPLPAWVPHLRRLEAVPHREEDRLLPVLERPAGRQVAAGPFLPALLGVHLLHLVQMPIHHLAVLVAMIAVHVAPLGLVAPVHVLVFRRVTLWQRSPFAAANVSSPPPDSPSGSSSFGAGLDSFLGSGFFSDFSPSPFLRS